MWRSWAETSFRFFLIWSQRWTVHRKTYLRCHMRLLMMIAISETVDFGIVGTNGLVRHFLSLWAERWSRFVASSASENSCWLSSSSWLLTTSLPLFSHSLFWAVLVSSSEESFSSSLACMCDWISDVAVRSFSLAGCDWLYLAVVRLNHKVWMMPQRISVCSGLLLLRRKKS